MKNLLKPLFSKGMLIFAVIVALLDLLAIGYIQGVKSLWLVLVLEATAVIAYLIVHHIQGKDETVWGTKQE